MAGTSNTLSSLGGYIDLLSGFAFKSKSFTQNSKDIPLVKGSNVHQGYIDWTGAVRWPIEEHPIKDKYWLKENDVVLAMDRPWIESGLKFSWIKRNDPKSLLVQRVCRMRGVNGLSSRYLRYIIGSPQFTNYIKPIVTGVNVPHISGQQIKDFKFSLPCKEIQVAVADLLENYDNLIDNNNRRIAILEDMAQSLYREWFVNFRYPGHADNINASSFNALNENQGKAKLIDSPLGPIPEGWEVKRIKDIGTVNTGKTPSKTKPEYYNSAEIPFLKTPDMHGAIFSVNIRDYLSTTGANSQKNKFVPANSICVSCIGARAGVVTITSEKLQTNQQINSVVLNDLIFREYFYLFAVPLHQKIHALGSSGATMTNVNKSKFEGIEVIVPPEKVIQEFNLATGSSFDLILNLQKRNKNLKQQRDMLLPKLISGQIELKD